MAKLLAVGSDQNYPIGEHPIVIGRSSQCTITIDDSNSSRQHCEVGKDENGYYVRDLNSYNGTFVNNKRISHHILVANDKIKIGNTHFIFDAESVDNRGYLLVDKFAGARKHKIALMQGKNSIGRSKGNDICLMDDQVSSQHAEIYWEEGKPWLRDLQSRNGTFVRGQRLASKPVMLKPGDRIIFGKLRCIFVDGREIPEKRSKSTSVVAAIAVFSILFAALWAWFHFSSVSAGVHGHPDNLLYDFSFEEGMGWHTREGMTIVRDNAAKTGKSFLRCTPQQQYTEHVAMYWETIPLNYGKAYRISSWMRSANLQGVAGIRLDWLCYNSPDYTIQHYSSLITGTSQWQIIEDIFIPPTDARRLKVTCFVWGTAEYVDFDDVTLVEIEKTSKYERLQLEHLGLRVVIDQHGFLEIYREGQLVLAEGRFALWQESTDEQKIVADQLYSRGEVKLEGEELSWQGKLILENDEIPAEVRCRKGDKSVAIEVSIAPKGEGVNAIEYNFIPRANFVDGDIYLVTEYQPQMVQQEEIVGQEITQMVWHGKNQAPIGFLYGQPTTCSIVAQPRSILRQRAVWLEKRRKFSLHIHNRLERDTRLVSEWKSRIETLQKEQRLGAVYQLYREMLNSLLFYKEQKSPKIHMVELDRQFRDDLELLVESLEQARFLQARELYQLCQQQCQEALERWQGMPELHKLERLIQRVTIEKEQIEQEQQQEILQRWQRQAEDLQAEKQLALALLFYEQIARHLGNSEEKSHVETTIRGLKKKLGVE